LFEGIEFLISMVHPRQKENKKVHWKDPDDPDPNRTGDFSSFIISGFVKEWRCGTSAARSVSSLIAPIHISCGREEI
jgi:hypothetical protein